MFFFLASQKDESVLFKYEDELTLKSLSQHVGKSHIENLKVIKTLLFQIKSFNKIS